MCAWQVSFPLRLLSSPRVSFCSCPGLIHDLLILPLQASSLCSRTLYPAQYLFPLASGQMHPQMRTGAHQAYLLFITLDDYKLSPHILAGRGRIIPGLLGHREKVAAFLEGRPVPGTAAAQTICWGRQVRMDACSCDCPTFKLSRVRAPALTQHHGEPFPTPLLESLLYPGEPRSPSLVFSRLEEVAA